MVSTLKVDEIRPKTTNGTIIMPETPAFLATGAAAYTAYTAYQKIAFNDITSNSGFNIGNHFDTSTYQFTCPVDGVYWFGAGCLIQTEGALGILIKNNSTSQTIRDYNWGRSATPNGLMQCSANDTIEVQAEAATSYYLGVYGRFTGYLVG
jgi:hypothetical protein